MISIATKHFEALEVGSASGFSLHPACTGVIVAEPHNHAEHTAVLPGFKGAVIE
jgi:hypothetical protein